MGTTAPDQPRLPLSSWTTADRIRSRTLLIGVAIPVCRIGLWWWLRSARVGRGLFCCIPTIFPEIMLAQPLSALHEHLADAALCLLVTVTSLLLGRLVALCMEPREENGPPPTGPPGA